MASEQTELLDRASRTIEHMKVDPAFERARHMMKDAKAVLVIPGLVRGGFIFGAEGGNGVLMGKNGAGWSEPAFYTMGSASFGLQAGLEQTEVVMLIMSDRALEALTRAEFKFGAGASLTLVDLSAGASAQHRAQSLGRHHHLDLGQGALRRPYAQRLRREGARRLEYRLLWQAGSGQRHPRQSREGAGCEPDPSAAFVAELGFCELPEPRRSCTLPAVLLLALDCACRARVACHGRKTGPAQFHDRTQAESGRRGPGARLRADAAGAQPSSQDRACRGRRPAGGRTRALCRLVPCTDISIR